MTEQQEREAFESWLAAFDPRNPNRPSTTLERNEAWRAWQARAARAMSPKPTSGTSLAANVPADLCERICAAIKATDDKSVDEADYMLDSNDCIAIVRAQFAAAPAPEAEPSKHRPSAEWYRGMIQSTEGMDESLPCGALAAPAPEAVTKNEWRELALRFDAQRMAALSHLRMLLDHGEAHAEAVRKFLAEPPRAAQEAA